MAVFQEKSREGRGVLNLPIILEVDEYLLGAFDFHGKRVIRIYFSDKQPRGLLSK